MVNKKIETDAANEPLVVDVQLLIFGRQPGSTKGLLVAGGILVDLCDAPWPTPNQVPEAYS